MDTAFWSLESSHNVVFCTTIWFRICVWKCNRQKREEVGWQVTTYGNYQVISKSITKDYFYLGLDLASPILYSLPSHHFYGINYTATRPWSSWTAKARGPAKTCWVRSHCYHPVMSVSGISLLVLTMPLERMKTLLKFKGVEGQCLQGIKVTFVRQTPLLKDFHVLRANASKRNLQK